MNNREIAGVCWLGGFLLLALSRREVRQEAWPILRTLAGPKLALPLCAMVTYVGAMLYGGSRVGLWDSLLVSETVA